MILTTKLKLDKYLDIDIYDQYDTQEDTILECDVDYFVLADVNGLHFDINEIKNINLSYTGIVYGDEDDIETPITITDFSEFNKEITFLKSDNEEDKLIFLTSVDINIDKKTIEFIFNF